LSWGLEERHGVGADVGAPSVPLARDIGRDALDWIARCALIYGGGKVIFKDYTTGAAFLAVTLAARLYIYCDLSRRGWRSVVE
jgi:hypothetical protein